MFDLPALERTRTPRARIHLSKDTSCTAHLHPRTHNPTTPAPLLVPNRARTSRILRQHAGATKVLFLQHWI